MIRDTSLLYELSHDLKDHRFINYDNDDLVSDSQLERMYQYLDDIVIDLFFHYNGFKPIIVPKGILTHRQSINGPVKVDPNKEIILSLNNIFDRYTFLKAFILFCMKRIDYECEGMSKKVKEFLCKLTFDSKLYSAFGRTIIIKDEFHYNSILEDFKYEYRNFDFWGCKAMELYTFKEYITTSPKSGRMDLNYFEFADAKFGDIKEEKIFGDYTWFQILSIYSILVEKLQIKHQSISALIARYIPKSEHISDSILAQFNDFESKINRFFDKERDVEINDLYLRFANVERSKAFTINHLSDKRDWVSVQLFSQTPVEAVDFWNTLPLPYRNNKLLYTTNFLS